MIKYKYKVTVNDFNTFTIKSAFSSDDINHVVEEAVRHYYLYMNGLENSWPVILVIFDDYENLLGKFEVEIKFGPIFSVCKKE